MVAFRLLQGVFGAAIVPLSQTFLLDINPREKAGQAMAMWGAGIMVGPIIGPTLGGWLTESFNWRWVFLINLPVGIAGHRGLLRSTCRARRAVSARFDFFGFAMLSSPSARLQLMLDRGGEVDWFASAEIWTYLVPDDQRLLGLRRSTSWAAEKPFLDPRMFTDRNFVDRAVLHLRHRHHPAGEPCAAAADAVAHLRLSDDHHRPGDGAARGGHDDLDADRRPAGAPCRSARCW